MTRITSRNILRARQVLDEKHTVLAGNLIRINQFGKFS
jgi:hypothetical protein